MPGISSCFAILDNAGKHILLSKANSPGKLVCDGLVVTTEAKKGRPVRFLEASDG
jgi:hypothetical protein